MVSVLFQKDRERENAPYGIPYVTPSNTNLEASL